VTKHRIDNLRDMTITIETAEHAAAFRM